jgi:hypothetical protein
LAFGPPTKHEKFLAGILLTLNFELVRTGKVSNLVLSKRKEVKVYEEISGVFCSVSVFCDLFVDGLQSITAAGETGRGEGSPGSAWSTGSAWSAWSPWSTCARKEIEAGYQGISSPRGYTP